MTRTGFFCSASTIAALASFAVAGPAAAQAVQAAGQQSGTTVGEVVVTGSFIRGTPEDAALPVDVIGADELEKQGSPSTLELIKNLPASNGVIGDTNQFDGRAQGAEGAATVNLRGLGASRTLILFNGRRVVIAPIGQGAPDVNLLPSAAIGRIEVLKDGAAATYGSDAIGGVVNFITRRNFDGLEINGSYRMIDGSDGDDWTAQAVWGKDFGAFNVMLTGGYQHRSELSVRERDFTQVSYFDSPETGYSTGNAVTAFLPLMNTATGGFTPAAGLQRDAGCAPLGGTPTFSGTTPACAFNYTPYDNLVEEENRFQLYGEINWDIAEDHRLHIEGLYSETDTPQWATSPSYLALQSPTSTTSPAVASGLAAGYFVPSTNPGFALYRQQNPTQIPSFATGAYLPGVLYRPLSFGGNPLFGDNSSRGSRKYEAFRLSASLAGEFGNGIGYDVAATYMTDNLVRIGYDALVSRLQLALRGLGGEGCSPTTGTPGVGPCRWFNPFSNAIQSNVLTGQTNPNYSAAVANDPELIRWFFQPTGSDLTTKLFVVDAVLNGELGWELGGGAVGWALGAQYRKDQFEGKYDALTDLTVTPCIDTPVNGSTNCTVRNGPFLFLGGATPSDLKGDVWAGFGEVSLPFTDSIQMQLAARYEDHGSGVGSTFNPKASVRWQFSDLLAARGSVGTTFRAPPLTSLDPGQVTSLQFLGGAFRAVDIIGNPDLEPEEATTYNIGLIASSGGFTATIDYWNFDFDNPLVTEPVGGMFSTMFPTGAGTGNCGNPAFAALQSRFVFGAGGVCSVANLSRIRTFVVNGPKVKTNGIDVLANYRMDDVWGGSAAFGVTATYTNEYSVGATTVEGVVVSPAFEGVNHLNYQTQIVPVPDWKGTAFAEYTMGPHNIRVQVNHIASYIDQRTSPFPPNVVQNATGATQLRSNEGRKIDAFTTVDAAWRYQAPWDTTFVFDIDNLLDEDPPFARLDLGYDPFTANPLGRTFKLSVTKRF
ncbi:TonB-dependent receptor [Phenylobacterium sp. J367]|uniref:TonB-dependent receptor n=1 Tax=Phenylobacterium sp. J367 TaxID=2898435 RepID=UPI0021517990|nr:TonB-dependent receptor [Phenylobacterium sp. J367]MCR5878448.1 TonB-dependent receptor [Phenylobacterium sp. J367]